MDKIIKLTSNIAELIVGNIFFVNRVAPMWNYLTSNVVKSRTLTKFKRELENFDLMMHCRGRAHTVPY